MEMIAVRFDMLRVSSNSATMLFCVCNSLQIGIFA